MKKSAMNPVSMRIKSYFAHSVERAIQQAREELGGEATLITSRRAARGERHLGTYEVVFGVEKPAEESSVALNPGDLNNELNLLRDQLDGIKRLLKLNGSGGHSFDRPELADLYARLIASGFTDLSARQIAEESGTRWNQLAASNRNSGDVLWSLAGECSGQRMRFAPEYAAPAPDSSRAIVLVGPPGAGKTTTLTKIAIQECVARRQSLRLISLDLHRPAAHEKLRSYAAIIGAGCSCAGTAAEFVEAIEEYKNKNVLLIDTPGYGPRDAELTKDLLKLLSQVNNKEVHLVIPASMKTNDALRSIQMYEPFQPDYLLFTKLDETDSAGSVISIALETGRPVSYLTRGQDIPDDFQKAGAAALLSDLFKNERAEAISAA